MQYVTRSSRIVRSVAIESVWRRQHHVAAVGAIHADHLQTTSPGRSCIARNLLLRKICRPKQMLWRAASNRVCLIRSSTSPSALRSLLFVDHSPIQSLPRFTTRPAVFLACSMATNATKKRKIPPTGPSSKGSSPAKRARPDVPDYHLTPSVKDADGEIQWPAPKAQITRAREIVIERYVDREIVMQCSRCVV